MMAERRIMVGPGAQATGRDIAIRINGARPTFRIATDKLATRLVAPIPDRLLDLVEIASAVFAADSVVTRGGPTRPNFGKGWRRQFAFDVAVRDASFWRRTELQSALAGVIDALSEDQARFAFRDASRPAEPQDYFPFDASADDAFRCEEVILFSGGLDSLTGAIETLENSAGRVALVTHLSASKRMPHQKLLVAKLQRLYPGRVLWLPVAAQMAMTPRRESTQRTRSLLFTALAFTAARMLEGRRVTFFENGIVSQHLPFGDQVTGTMATRTTHPLGLFRLADLMSLVAGDDVTIANPFEWLTKTEVLEKLRELGAEDLVPHTVSCSRVWRRTKTKPHCGVCSQCLDRRFAVLASGLGEHDPAGGYGTDVLTDPRGADQGKTMAVDWALHAVAMSDMKNEVFLGRFGGEAMRIVDGFPDQASVTTMSKIIDMHRRHGTSVLRVIEDALEPRLGALLRGALPPTSLLAMFIAAKSGGLRIPTPGEAPEYETGPPPASDILPLRVLLTGDGFAAQVRIDGLGDLSPAPSRVVAAFVPAHLEDRAAGRAPEDHRFVPGAEAAREIGESKAFVRKNVERCRAELAEYYIAVEDASAPS